MTGKRSRWKFWQRRPKQDPLAWIEEYVLDAPLIPQQRSPISTILSEELRSVRQATAPLTTQRPRPLRSIWDEMVEQYGDPLKDVYLPDILPIQIDFDDPLSGPSFRVVAA